jgi:hypothetical protein
VGNGTSPDETVLVPLRAEELRILTNALNEVLNGISDRTLPSRMGASREEVETLRVRLRDRPVEPSVPPSGGPDARLVGRSITNVKLGFAVFWACIAITSCVAGALLIVRDGPLVAIALLYVNGVITMMLSLTRLRQASAIRRAGGQDGQPLG